jgi:RND family efflux transporter MFP subunit
MLQLHGGLRPALIGLCLVTALLLLVLGSRSLWTSAAAHAIPAQTALLLPGAIVRIESGFDLQRVFSGQLMSYQDAGLGFETAGVVDTVLVAEGDQVVAGQVLARLRRAEQQAAVAEQQAVLAQAEAAVEEARAQLRLAELVRERRRRLADREVLAAEALEMAETDLESRRARVRASEGAELHARASLARWRARLDQTELRAPHNGVVAALPARVGQSLDAGAVAVRLVDLNRPLVHVGLPAALAATIAPGADLTLQIGSTRYAAQLVSLAPTVDAPTRTVLAVLRPNGSLSAPRAGELVRVEVRERKDDPGAWLPLSALVEGRRGLWSGHFVRPLDRPGDRTLDGIDEGNGIRRGGEVEQRPLQVVHVEGDRAFVRGPFAEGDVYLRGGLHRAVPGQQVRVSLD